MKNSPKNIGLLMVTIVAISVGLTYVTVGGVPEVTLDKVATGSLFTGNVQVRLMDANGDVKAFRQTDNHITVTGMEILASQLFNDTRQVGNIDRPYNAQAWRNFTDTVVGDPNTIGVNTGGTVKYMNIGNGTDPLEYRDRQLSAQIDDGGVRTPGCERIIARIQNASTTNTNRTATGFEAAAQVFGGANLAQINITAVATFDGANCYAKIIHEAGFWTDSNITHTAGGPGITPDNGWMFARNTFGNVDLTANDSLELTWTFTFTDS